VSAPVRFSASYDRTTTIVTALTCVAMAVATYVSQKPFVAWISAAIIAAGYAYSPQRYEVGDGMIVVKRLIGNVRVPLDHLREARLITPEDLRGAIRLWGSGGLFGYYGIFRTSKLGNCRWYVTNRATMLVVVTKSKTTLYSPDDPDGFLAAVRG
jgi:hypothetical protein